MIQFNIQTAGNNFYSYEAIISYLGKDYTGKPGDWSYYTKDFTDKVEFEKHIKKFIKKNKSTYEVVINKIIWKSKEDHDIYNKIYYDPITGQFVFPDENNVWKATEIYKYAIQNDKALLIK